MRRNELRALHLPIADELAKRSGSRPKVRPQECEPYAVAGVVPALVFSPRTLAEASKIVSTITSEGASIAIRGAGTKAYRPPHPRVVDVVLDTSRCSGVLDHTPADLTVTVEAGTPFALLQQTLLAHGQFFPADPPFGAQTTIGGMLSAKVAGALRQRYSAPRDSVLGMRVCLSDGSIAFTGSRVVKSVAGYDIPKLFVGAFGTLGIIGEVTLKVAPLPRHERGLAGSFARCEDACEAARRIACSPLFPLATTLHDRSAAAARPGRSSSAAEARAPRRSVKPMRSPASFNLADRPRSRCWMQTVCISPGRISLNLPPGPCILEIDSWSSRSPVCRRRSRRFVPRSRLPLTMRNARGIRRAGWFMRTSPSWAKPGRWSPSVPLWARSFRRFAIDVRAKGGSRPSSLRRPDARTYRLYFLRTRQSRCGGP